MHSPCSTSQAAEEHSSQSSCDHVSIEDGSAGSCSCSEWGDNRPPLLDLPPEAASSSGFLSPSRLLGSMHAVEQAAEAVTAVPLPGFAVPMQSSLLKRIGAFRTKEELLEFVGSYHMFLDVINLVTCLYRFAKLSIGQRSRGAYLLELQRAPAFQLLLRTISSKFLQAQLAFLHHTQDVRGVDDARCLSNLVWSLVKLDLSSDAASLSNELALNVAPFVCRCLDDCSPQGLANMLWAYSKLSVTPPEVVAGLVDKIADKLSAPARGYNSQHFDAQALSNSIWALAHLKGRGMDLDAIGCNLVRFLEALAHSAVVLLAQRHYRRPDVGSVAACRAFLESAETAFSCQALVNIAWSFATLIGVGCSSHAPIRQLFNAIHAESTARLMATSTLLKAGQRLGPGGFNEQALSNAVFAFDKAGLLRRDLLEAIYAVATQRLAHGERAGAISFKAQELCTLLKTCHSGIAEPWTFLTALLRVSTHHPAATASWAAAEQAELHRAYQLLLSHNAAQEWQQQKQQQEAQLLQQHRRQQQQLHQLLQQQQLQQQRAMLQVSSMQPLQQLSGMQPMQQLPGHMWLQQPQQQSPMLSSSAALAALGIPDLGTLSLDLLAGLPAGVDGAQELMQASQVPLLLERSRAQTPQPLQSYQAMPMPYMRLQ